MTICVDRPKSKPPPVTPAAVPGGWLSATAGLNPKSEAIARVLDTPRLTLGEIGKAVGASRFALEKYRNGQRPLPPVTRIRLADYLEAHARQVQADADALRASPRADQHRPMRGGLGSQF